MDPARMARGLRWKPLYAEGSGGGGTRIRAGSPGIRSPQLSDPSRTAPAQTPEVWVPSAVASANRLGSEVRVGCVPSSWEQV